jgi:thymidine kinase
MGWIEIVTGPMFCHRVGQLILMADGRSLPVELIDVGDQLMGPSGPRSVHALHRGISPMCKIKPTSEGADFVVTLDHLLTLADATNTQNNGSTSNAHNPPRCIDVSVRNWLKWPTCQKRRFKLFKCGVPKFAAPDLQSDDLDAYLLGLLLSDPELLSLSSNTANCLIYQNNIKSNKDRDCHHQVFQADQADYTDLIAYQNFIKAHISTDYIASKFGDLGLSSITSSAIFVPQKYKSSEHSNRLRLLAGLLDSRPQHHNGTSACYLSPSKQLAEDMAFLAQSLNFNANISQVIRTSNSDQQDNGASFQIDIEGDLAKIPSKIKRNSTSSSGQTQVNMADFEVELLPDLEPFFGFTLDGDGRYMLGDFTVTHNSGKSEELIRRIKRAMIGKLRIAVFKPAADDRYHSDDIVSHSQQRLNAIAIEHPKEILDRVGVGTSVVGIDEAQFFNSELIDTCEALADLGLRVIVAGLDQDYRGQPFGPIPNLMAVAESITKLQAVCMRCGAPATRSQRITSDVDQMVVGSADIYEARCRLCFERPGGSTQQNLFDMIPKNPDSNNI